MLFWPILIGMIIVYLLITSVYVVDPDKLLAIIRMGSYKSVFVSDDYFTDMKGKKGNGDTKDARSNSIDLIVLPYPIYRPQYYPATSILLRYHVAGASDRNDAPLDVDIAIAFELDAYLKPLIRSFNLFGKERDLARETEVRYLVERNQETKEEKFETYQSTCLAQYLVDMTTDVVQDRVRHLVGRKTYTELKEDLSNFEAAVRFELASPESRFARAGILIRRPEVKKDDAFPGRTIKEASFDFNILRLRAESDEYQKALSASAIAEKERQAAKIRGTGEGERLQAIHEKSGMPVDEMVRNETLRSVEELNVIATSGDPLQSVIAKLLAKKE